MTVTSALPSSPSRGHPQIILAARVCLVCFTAGCTTLTNEVMPAPSFIPTIPAPSMIPEIKVYDISPNSATYGAGTETPSHGDLINQGKSPLPGAVPGSENILMKFHGKGEARIVLPHQRSGALLWILVGCESEAPLSILTYDLHGSVMARYDLEPCRAAEGGGGTEDSSSTVLEIFADPNVIYDLTVISSEMSETSDLGHTSRQPHASTSGPVAPARTVVK